MPTGLHGKILFAFFIMVGYTITMKIRNFLWSHNMIKLIPVLLIILFYPACSSGPVKKADSGKQEIIPTGDFIDVKTIEDFFRRCEKDINRAREVIIKRDLIKNLTHLQNMDSGGKKYYLLERENITGMIKAVTENTYHDFILINKSGTVIYTMKSDDLFGKNVRTTLKSTPLNRCYENRNSGIHLEDMSISESLGNIYAIFISTKVTGDNSFPGIFILQVGADKIAELLSKKTAVIGTDGRYRIIHDREKMLLDYPYADRITVGAGPENDRIYRFNLPGKGDIHYRFFKFKNLSWIIVSED